MKQTPERHHDAADRTVKDIPRKTRLLNFAAAETTSKRRIQQVVPFAFIAPDIIR